MFVLVSGCSSSSGSWDSTREEVYNYRADIVSHGGQPGMFTSLFFTAKLFQISVGQYLRKVAASSPQPSAAEGGPPPVKRVFYCDPNNPNVATVHTEPIVAREEKKEGGEAGAPSTTVPRLYKIAAPRIDAQNFSAASSTKSSSTSSSDPPPPTQQPQERPEVIQQQSLMEIT